MALTETFGWLIFPHPITPRIIASLWLFPHYFYEKCSDELQFLYPSAQAITCRTGHVMYKVLNYSLSFRIHSGNQRCYTDSFQSRSVILWNMPPRWKFPDQYSRNTSSLGSTIIHPRYTHYKHLFLYRYAIRTTSLINHLAWVALGKEEWYTK